MLLFPEVYSTSHSLKQTIRQDVLQLLFFSQVSPLWNFYQKTNSSGIKTISQVAALI